MPLTNPAILANQTGQPPDISIVITCFNQAQYLADAIESVLKQTHRRFEVLVIDDGSHDNPEAIAVRYPEVVFLKQSNRGACLARNRGIELTSGPLLVFMDGDDRLLPHAFEAGLAAFTEHPECAFVYGGFDLIESDGSRRTELPPIRIECDHYQAFLIRNFLVLHAGMFRREAIEQLGAFNPVDWEGADLDLYLRMTRSLPAFCHGHVVAERRVHHAQASQNWLPMLGSSLRVLHRQWPFVKSDPVLRSAYLAGRNQYKTWFGERLLTETYLLLQQGQWRMAIPRLMALARYYLSGLMALARGLRRSNTIDFFVLAQGSPIPVPAPAATSAGKLEILALTPKYTIAGERFNALIDGRSVLRIECRNASARTTIIFDGKPLRTVYRDGEYVEGNVPYGYIRQEGHRPVFLLK